MENENFYEDPDAPTYNQPGGVTYNDKGSFINVVSTGVAYGPNDFLYVEEDA